MTNPERLTPEELEEIIKKIHERNILEGMWNPNYYDPEIPLSDEELDEFISTFAKDEQGEKIETWIKGGAKCEALHEEIHDSLAVASIDWTGVTISDSVLVCGEDLRQTYRTITKDCKKQGLNPTLTINGKEIPRAPIEEHISTSPDTEI